MQTGQAQTNQAAGNQTEIDRAITDQPQTNEAQINQKNTAQAEIPHEKASGYALSCDIIRDLLPSYVDGICSEASKKIVGQHLLTCADCAALMDALGESEAKERQWETRQIAYMKKIKKSTGKKEVIGLAILLAAILFSLWIFSEHYGAVSWLYLVVLPLILADTHFLLTDHMALTKQTEPKIILLLASGLLLCASMLLALISIQWVSRQSYPFGLEAADLGGFLRGIYLFLALCQFAIFAGGVALTLKTANSHGIVISVSATGLFLILYILSVFASMSSPEMSKRALGQSLYILFEGVCVAAAAEGLQRKKLQKEQ